MHALPDENTMFEAVLKRDGTFEGIFCFGVKTTGVFCRPTCTARKPKRENIEFFPSGSEAVMNGYRPCRICKPLSFEGDTPAWLAPLLDEIAATPGIRLKDADLLDRGLEPNRVRRWFRKQHGMTFQSYLRAQRMGLAFESIRSGEKVIDAAFESGYESLAAFTESFRKATGFTPQKSRSNQMITMTRVLTPLGPMLAGATDKGLCLLEFLDKNSLQTQLGIIEKMFRSPLVPGTNALLEAVRTELDEYFAGRRQVFDIALDIQGTPFQKEAWQALTAIPYGETRSYGEQARSMGRTLAVRAVANANGANRISIIIPCHRVIGGDGTLTGYGGGLWRKKFLLALESANKDAR